MLSCKGCGAQRETRYLRDGLCFSCSKGKTTAAIGAPTSNFLTASALSRLPDQSQEIKPADSLSIVGDKRRYELMEQELARFHDEQSSERSRHEQPEKRPQPKEAWTTSTAPMQTSHIGLVVYVTHTDAEVIE
jgi:hypothetical protein